MLLILHLAYEQASCQLNEIHICIWICSKQPSQELNHAIYNVHTWSVMGLRLHF